MTRKKKDGPPGKPPAYQHYAQDWLVGTAHLTLEAQGAYQRLLDHQWVDGPLPDDGKKLARILGVPASTFRRIWEQLEDHFPLVNDSERANARLETERLKQTEYRHQQSEAGLKGAVKRWGNEANGDAMATPLAKAVAKHGSSSSSSSSIPTPTPSVDPSDQPGEARLTRARKVADG